MYFQENADDAALVRRCLEGETAAFEALVARYQRLAFTVALRMVGDYEDQAIRPRALGRFRDLLEATLRHPAMLLAAVIVASGVLSAFLVNDTICLVMTPLVLDLVPKLKRNPTP